jgi:hypothetical protein
MPGSDASQFTQFKRTGAVHGISTRTDGKTTNRLTQYVSPLGFAENSNKFLPSLTLKNLTPRLRIGINMNFIGKKNPLNQNCY